MSVPGRSLFHVAVVAVARLRFDTLEFGGAARI
jgi:hypothetical protein